MINPIFSGVRIFRIFAVNAFLQYSGRIKKTEDHWSCIAHLSAEDMLKSVVIEEKK